MNVTVEVRNEARALVDRLRKQARCVYIAVEREVADDLADELHRAANMIETYVVRATL